MAENKEFECENCHKKVLITKAMGTNNRNHCPFCLWSKHVDDKSSGDRASLCDGLMRPIGLTFKNEGTNKYGDKKQGELMVVHQCQKCEKYVINRIAADDSEERILIIYNDSLLISEQTKGVLAGQNITLLTDEDEQEIKTQLFGK